MSDAANMLRELSYPWEPGQKIKSVIHRISKPCRLHYWRTWDIWYRKARRIEPHEVEQIKEALRLKNEKAARNEFHELKSRLAILEAALLSRDPDFHCEDVDVLRSIALGRSGANSTVARKR